MAPRRHRSLEKYAWDPGSESTGQMYQLKIKWAFGLVFGLEGKYVRGREAPWRW